MCSSDLNLQVLRDEADVLSHASPHTADDAAAIARRLAECKREIQEATFALENRRVALLYERGLRQYFGELFWEVSKRLSGCAMLPPAVLNELAVLGLDPRRQGWRDYRRPEPQRVRKLRTVAPR